MSKLNNSLSNTDIVKIVADMGLRFNGVYSRDDLPHLREGFYVINLDDHKSKGTHWTAFYYNPTNHSIYFDAFGFPPPEEVERKIKPYTFNDIDIQDIDSSACGYYCIAFIKFLSNHKDKYKAFETFINLFSEDTKQNDKVLYKILY